MVERVGWLSFNSSLLRERLVSYPYPYPGPPGQAGWLSDTYPYLLHIMHPTGGPDDPSGAGTVTWAHIADARGIHLRPGRAFYDVVGIHDPAPILDGVFDELPESGKLPTELQQPLYEHLNAAQWGLLWDGFHCDPVDAAFYDEADTVARTVESEGGLRYHPLTIDRTGRPSAMTSRSPNFWWPQDHSWVAATGIDEYETLVASTDWALLDQIHHDPRFETHLFSRETNNAI